MTPITFKTDTVLGKALHRIIHHYGCSGELWRYPKDMCTAIKAFGFGMLQITLAIVALGTIFSAYTDLLVWAYVNYFVGSITMHRPAVLALVMAVVIVVVLLLVGVERAVYRARTAHTRRDNVLNNIPPIQKRPSFIVHAWKSIHDKICIPIEFE